MCLPCVAEVAPRLEGVHHGDREVSLGQRLLLPCSLVGKPRPFIIWYKDGERIDEREQPRYVRVSTSWLRQNGFTYVLLYVHVHVCR